MPPDRVLEGEDHGVTGGDGATRAGIFARVRGWFSRKGKKARRPESARRRIAFWAIAIGLVSGTLDVPMPLEDIFRLGRDTVRLRPADGQTVLVMIDDRSLDELGTRDPLRGDDARLVDGLFAHGAMRVVFDRSYSDISSSEEDAKLLASLKRHEGRVFIGSTPVIKSGFGGTAQLLTHPRFRGRAPMVSMYGKQRVFGLSWGLPTSSEILGKRVPSISAELAGVDDMSDTIYRPDLSIDFKTIPMLSYVDVLKGRVPASTFAGKDVIIAPANRTSPDLYVIPWRGMVAGAQIHALGAQTLRERVPVDLGWLPPFLLVALFILYQARRRMPSRRSALALGSVILAAQALLELASIHMAVMSALLCLAIGAVRLRSLANSTYRGETGLVRIEHLHSSEIAPECDVIALKIRNFATISACLSPKEIDELLVKAEDMLRSAEGGSQFAFHKDTLVWLRDRIHESDRGGHLRGLHAVFRTSITVGSQAPDMATSIGLDTNYLMTLRERTENAIQCAEDAAHHGSVFVISDSDIGEDRTWKLHFFSELEKAIRNRDIKVAFQPKISLRTGKIVGAEALVRWTHPLRGPIEPSEIVAYAEEHNRIEMITRFVLDNALHEACRAIEVEPGFAVAVNISALDLRDPGFASDVAMMLAKHSFPAGQLVLEITETAPIENDRVAGEILAELKRLGVRLSVDDFGTGHASLHYLRQIPSDEVKIDRSFVANMAHSQEDRTLVKTAIDMIHSLRRYAVAEGVEDDAVARMLTELGCDAAQGFYFSRAVGMDRLLEQLEAKSRAA
ncbi:EAL domain-containing protein [Tsuneonella sp. YG55]|uniref:EAL domain-containing protein n=1 Tax=Tsuneonella litorea TaxID=2976475 RepID=A0A9X2VZJ0_9SPHN|nr:EAL domain-containing protein [Tsuneonella litorea]MCT2558143.1 EAL domain-containing protein [Tsuneonella litorea]